MGYSGIRSDWYKAWHKAFLEQCGRQPTIEEAFHAGWKYDDCDRVGYTVEQAIDEAGVLFAK